MKTNWKIIVLSLLIGGFVGAAISLTALRYCRPDWGSGRPRGEMRKKLYRELKLTPEQKAQVDVILKEKREKVGRLFTEGRPKMEAIRIETKAQIRALLTPEQQANFDVLSA